MEDLAMLGLTVHSDGVVTATARLRELEKEVRITASVTTKMVTATDRLAASMKRFVAFEAEIKKVINAFGGPLVLGIKAALAAVTYFSTRQTEAERIAEKYSDTIAGLKGSASQAEAALKALEERINSLSEAQAKASLKDAKIEMAVMAKEFGKITDGMQDMPGLFTAVYQQGDAAEAVIRSLGERAAEFRNDVTVFQQFKDEIELAYSDGVISDKFRKSLHEAAANLAAPMQMIQLLEKYLAAFSTTSEKAAAGGEKFAGSITNIGNASGNAAESVRTEMELYDQAVEGSSLSLKGLGATAQNVTGMVQENCAKMAKASDELGEHLPQGQAFSEAGKNFQKFDGQCQAALGNAADMTGQVRAEMDLCNQTVEGADPLWGNLEAGIQTAAGTGVEWIEGLIGKMLKLGLVSEDTAAKIRAAVGNQPPADKGTDAAQNFRDAADFYAKLADLSGDYGLSIQYQNKLIDEQVENWEKIEGIHKNDLEVMRKLKKLQISRDFDAGVTRAFIKYKKEAQDLGKQAESTFSSLFSGIDKSFQSMWQGLIEKGKLSMSSLKDVFNNFLAELAHMALTKPIMVSIAGGITSLFGGVTEAKADGMLGGVLDGVLGSGSGSGGVDWGAYADAYDAWKAEAALGVTQLQMPEPSNFLVAGSSGIGGVASGVSGLFSGDPGSILGGLSKLFNPQTYTELADKISSLFGSTASNATASAATSTVASALSVFATVAASVGAAFTGHSLGSYAGAKIMGGDKAGTQGAKDGGKVGAAVGAFHGLGAGLALGASFGSVVPVIGTLIGAAVGTIAGMMIGAGDVRKPTMMADVQGYLGYSEDMEGPYAGLNFADNDVMQEYFGKTFARWERERPGANGGRTFVHQSDYAIVGTSGQHLGGQQFETAPMIDEMGAALLDMMVAANQHALTTGELFNTIGDIATVLNDDFSVNMDEWKGFGFGDVWLEELRKIEIAWNGKKTGSKLGQKGLNDWAKELTAEIEGAYTEAFSKLDLSAIADRFDIDQTSYEGFTRFTEAVSMVNGMLAQTAALYEELPVTQVQEQVVELLESMNEQYEKMVETGVNAGYATRLVDDFLYGSLQKFINEVDRGVNPASQLAQETQKINAQFDDLVAGANMLGATQEDLIRIEQLRAQSLEQLRVATLQPIYQDFNSRVASLTGGDTQGLSLNYTHAQQRQEMVDKVGADSAEMKALLAVQEAERMRHAADRVANELSALASQAEDAANQASQAAAAFEEARNAVKSAIDAWVDGAQSAFDTAANALVSAMESNIAAYESLADSMHKARLNLWMGDTAPDPAGTYASAKSEMARLYAAYQGGDTSVASDLTGAVNSFLTASYASQADYGDYQRDFYDAQGILSAIEADALARAESVSAELEALHEQLGIEKKMEKSLEQLKDETVSARASLDKALEEQLAAYERWKFEAVVPGLAGLEAAYFAAAAKAESAQGASLSASQTSLSYQAQQTEYLKVIAASEAAAVKAAEAAAKAVEEAAKASKPGIYGSKYASEFDLLTAKAAQVNGTELATETVAAGGWNAKNLKEYMASDHGLTVAEWYERWGKLEGFASGGLATPGWALVGEDGPELVNFASRAMVYPAEETGRILAAQSDGSPRADAALAGELREQNQALKTVVRQLHAIIKNTKAGADSLDILIEGGLTAEDDGKSIPALKLFGEARQ